MPPDIPDPEVPPPTAQPPPPPPPTPGLATIRPWSPVAPGQDANVPTLQRIPATPYAYNFNVTELATLGPQAQPTATYVQPAMAATGTSKPVQGQ